METNEEMYDKLRQQCWNKSLNSFAISYIFDKKAYRLLFFLNLLKALGLAVPAAIGATALGYGLNSSILQMMIFLAIPLTIFQFLFSLLAVVYKWDDKLAYSYEASQDLGSLYDDFKNLANTPPKTYKALSIEFELLNQRYKLRVQQNAKIGIKEWENRMGMRYGLRQFQRKCVGCDIIPKSMESTNCNICGNFDKSISYKLFKL